MMRIESIRRRNWSTNRSRRTARRLFLEKLEDRSLLTAGAIISPISATIDDGGPGQGNISDTLNQNGLASHFTSGVTNFDSYLAANPVHTSIFSGFEWFSNQNTTGATVTYDLGSVFKIDRLALWNEESSGIGTLEILTSSDGETFNSLASGLHPTDNPDANYAADVFTFAPTSARFVRLIASDSPQPNPGSYLSAAIGEVAFRVAFTPEVSIVAIDATAAETPTNGTPNPGRFKITRTSEYLTTPLQVQLHIGGTAVMTGANGDYAAISSEITMTGAEVEIEIVPINDASKEQTETVGIELLVPEDGSYRVNPVSNYAAFVSIQDNDQWQAKIEASGANAFEAGEPVGEFKVTRIGETDLTYPLTVGFLIHGASTATYGADYDLDAPQHTGSPGSEFGNQTYYTVTIPAGQTSSTVTVEPIDDQDSNEDDFESVIANLISSSSYTIAAGGGAGIVWIEDDDKESPQNSEDSYDPECDSCCQEAKEEHDSCDVSAASGDGMSTAAQHSTSPMDGYDAGLRYDARSNPHPIVSVDVKFDEAAQEATTIEAQLTLGGIVGAPVFYDPDTLSAGELYRFALMADLSLPSGSYQWEMKITEHYDGEPDKIRTYNGRHEIVNRINSEFGNRWAHTQVDRIQVDAQNVGLTLIEGSGAVSFFRLTGPGLVFERETGEPGYTTITADPGNNTYTLRDKTGATKIFDGLGNTHLLRERFDPAGNKTTYHYIDVEGDGDIFAQELHQIVDPSGLTTTYNYTGTKVTSITDFAGRVTTLSYDANGRLIKVTQPDPDGEGELSAPEHHYAYNPTTGLLTSYTDPHEKVTTLEYRADRTVKKRIHHDDSFEEFGSSLNAGVVDTSVGLGTEANPAPLLPTTEANGFHKNELGKLSYFKSDRFGATTWEKDALGNETSYVRDSEGRATRITGPDPEGPETSPVTEFTYDAVGNVTQIKYPDNSTETWTYDPNFSRATSYTDQRGKQTLYTVDSSNGLVTAMRQVVGNVDGQQNGETDDVVTTFTYTPAPTQAEHPPAGLLKTTTDPLGHVTTNEYDTFGRLVGVTYAVGTVDEASVDLEYDAAGNLTASIDELNRRTDYEYDSLNRLTKATLPDPDGASGSALRPIYRYEYDKRNLRTKEIDPLGRETVYVYSDRGDLLEIRRPDHDNNGQLTVTAFGYDAARRLTTVTDPLGRTTTYTPDDIGQIVSTMLPDPDGGGQLVAPVYGTQYDALGRIKKALDARNSPTDFANVNFGRQVTSALPDPDGEIGPLARPTGTVAYDAAGNLTSSTDARGAVTTYIYDDLNRLISMREPNPANGSATGGPQWFYTYDKASNLRLVTDPNGNVSEHRYDNRNRLIKTIQPDPDGTGVQNPLPAPEAIYFYDDAGQLITLSDHLGRETTYEYDGLGRLSEVNEPDADGAFPFVYPQTTYGYDAVGRLTSVTDPLGNVTEYDYDLLDNLVTIVEADPDDPNPAIGPLESPVTQYVYDAAGQLKETTDSEGRVTSYEHDQLGRQTKVTLPDPDGADPLPRPFTTYTYDIAGNLKTVMEPDPDGAGPIAASVTTYDYDNLDRRTKTTDAEGGQTKFGYDTTGNLLSLTDPVNNTTTWVYDFLDRTTSETNQFNKSRTFQYDAIGNLTERIDRNGRKIVYEYDKLHRNTREIWFDADDFIEPVRTLQFGFDAAGQLSGASDPAAGYGYEYDDLGRLSYETQNFTDFESQISYSRAYDAAGNLTVLTGWDFVNGYTYDNLHRLTSVKQWDAGGPANVAQKRANFTYDSSGLFTSISRFADLDGNEHVVSSQYGYDGLGRLTKLIHNDQLLPLPLEGWGEGILAGYQYTYDAASRITSINSHADGLSSYSYDLTDQLTGADHSTQTPALSDEAYSYDANGNRTMGLYVVDGNNRLSFDGAFTYSYDDEGNLVSRYNNLTSESVEYEYDHRNRLVSVTSEMLPTVSTGWGPSTDWCSFLMSEEPEEWWSFQAEVQSAEEGDDVVLRLWFGQFSSLEYSVEPVSAEWESDYASQSGWIYVAGSEQMDILISTIADSIPEWAESFAIRVRPWGDNDPEHEIILEADIIDTGGGTGWGWGETSASGTAELWEQEEPPPLGWGPPVQSSTNGGAITFQGRLYNYATEGGSASVELTVSHRVQLEYWVEGSAEYGKDFGSYYGASGTFWVDPYPFSAVRGFSFIHDRIAEPTESLSIHIRAVGDPSSEIVFDAVIIDDDGPVEFGAMQLHSGTEDGSLLEIGLWAYAGIELELEYWVENISAVRGSDYTVSGTDPNITGGTVWMEADIDPYAYGYYNTVITGHIYIHPIDDSLVETTESVKIHVRIAGHPETEIVIEGDILNNDGVPSPPEADSSGDYIVEYAYDVFDQLIRRTHTAVGLGGTTTESFYSWQDGQIVGEFAGPDLEDLSDRYFWNPAAVDQLLASEEVDSPSSPGEVFYPLADHLGTTRDIAEYDAATTVVSHRIYDSYGNLIDKEETVAVDLLFGFTGRLWDPLESTCRHASLSIL